MTTTELPYVEVNGRVVLVKPLDAGEVGDDYTYYGAYLHWHRHAYPGGEKRPLSFATWCRKSGR